MPITIQSLRICWSLFGLFKRVWLTILESSQTESQRKFGSSLGWVDINHGQSC